jgi:hypothetical protein
MCLPCSPPVSGRVERLQELCHRAGGDDGGLLAGDAGDADRAAHGVEFGGREAALLQAVPEGRPLGLAADQADEGRSARSRRRCRQAATTSRSSAWLKLMTSTALPGASCATAACTGSECSHCTLARHVGREDLVAAVDPGERERQVGGGAHDGPADMAAAEQGDRVQRHRQPALQRWRVGRRDALVAQVHHAAAALAQAGPERIAPHLRHRAALASSSRAAAMASNSSRPPPMVPATACGATSIQAPVSRGPEPCTLSTVTSTALPPSANTDAQSLTPPPRAPVSSGNKRTRLCRGSSGLPPWALRGKTAMIAASRPPRPRQPPRRRSHVPVRPAPWRSLAGWPQRPPPCWLPVARPRR